MTAAPRQRRRRTPLPSLLRRAAPELRGGAFVSPAQPHPAGVAGRVIASPARVIIGDGPGEAPAPAEKRLNPARIRGNFRHSLDTLTATMVQSYHHKAGDTAKLRPANHPEWRCPL